MSIDKVLDNLELNKPIKEESTGRWFITGVAARLGVQDYTQEFGMHVFRGESLIKAMVEDLKFKNLTMGHFEQSPTENRDKRAGFIVDSVYKDGLAIVRLCIDHPYLCSLLDEKAPLGEIHLGLSVGYRTPVDKGKKGTWVDTNGIAGTKGQKYPYQAEQILPVSVNHLAVVPMGRGGKIVKLIMDEAPEQLSLDEIYFEDSLEIILNDNPPSDNGEEEPVGTSSNSTFNKKTSSYSDGGALYPYPTNKGYQTMTQEDMAGIYDKMSSMMDKMSKMCDSYNKMHDAMYGKMEDACGKMEKYSDNLVNALNYIEAIKTAFEEQDRGAGSGTVRSDTPNMIADEASDAFKDAVKGAVSLWLEFSDELKETVKDFGLTAADLRRELLKTSQVDIADDASDAEVNAAFSVYKALHKKMVKTSDAKPSEVDELFKGFKDSAPAPANAGQGYSRSANGTLTFDE